MARKQNTAGSRQSPRFPQTRYQGSKRRFMDWIGGHLEQLEFDSALDAFGGSGVVSHWLKALGKRVVYNDLLGFNHQIGLALVENDEATLTEEDIADIISPAPGQVYDDFIQRNFGGIYYTDAENAWLDVVAQNLRRFGCRYKRALGYYALFQSALAKRPYNLFHRKNLYLRLADVRRGFGNKVTWDRPFQEHFRLHAQRANAAVFSNGQPCQAIQSDVANVQEQFGLVYIDTPYINARGVGVDYLGFYHFLEGLIRYADWPELVDWGSKHLRMQRTVSPWVSPDRIHQAFRDLLGKFADSILVVSYRSDGIPSAEELVGLVDEVKPRVEVHFHDRYRYALSTNKRSREMLIVGSGFR
ncbi:MAG: DNA adenine methylase [Phycisphaerae bacterium]|nr:DNA adenine methylase [Phycisphaerae bacterium]